MPENTDAALLWEKAQPFLMSGMTNMSYKLWVEPLEPICVLNDSIILSTGNSISLDTLRGLYGPQVSEAIEQSSGVALKTVFIPAEEREKYIQLKEREQGSCPMLNSKFTFDNFVVGGSNKIAYAASKAVAASPASAYNPLFIYGDVGLGKTHLMHAIGNETKLRFPSYKVTYVTSETFTNELIQSIQDNTNAQFRNKYRSADMLMVDDVQFIAGKNSTQEEFFNTFNTLHTSGRQIVISSDKPPKEIPQLEKRLRSRFEGGLITDIQPPDYETRVAILKKKALLENAAVDGDVLALIAKKVNANIRQLEGAFTRVMAFSRLSGTPISVQMADAALKDVIAGYQERRVTPQLIQQIVADFYGVSVESMLSQRRTMDVAYPRQIAMYITRETTDLSLKTIGKYFGNRDYSTVISACKKIEENMKLDMDLGLVLKDLKKRLRGN